jgi:signal transduction histidine kinase/DNA-binding response OmpR family regulator
MLNVLHLEDNQHDAVLIEQAIVKDGILAKFIVVRDRSEFVSALQESRFDLVLADNGLPGFDSISALKMVREKYPNIGFICVSGAASEKQIRDSLRAGASDYILKDDLSRLVTAVRLEQERVHLRQMNRGMARLVKAVQELSLARDLITVMAIVRRAARELTGADGASFVLREGNLCYYADEDAVGPLWKGQKFPLTTCISGWTMLNFQPAVIEDIYADPRIPHDAYRPTFVKSLAMVPIRTNAPIGAIGNYWAARHLPTAEEVELLQALANTTSVAIENVRVYEELEQRVKDRTSELEETNRELDSYAHAVAHDLGAPLRRIQAFTQMTVKESGAVLNEKGREYLSIVEESVVQMRDLMADLMRLSKVSRTELKKEKINLSQLAGEITAQLGVASPQVKTDLQIAEGIEAFGDYGLLRIVMENLLSNAWKYSAKSQPRRIEFGKVTQPDNSPAYFVRDNGVGFEMEYAAQLFQPFKRLHRQDEYPGTGIGLTTVQRIIHRHGGQVRAEAKVNEGATFYFTLAPR